MWSIELEVPLVTSNESSNLAWAKWSFNVTIMEKWYFLLYQKSPRVTEIVQIKTDKKVEGRHSAQQISV